MYIYIYTYTFLCVRININIYIHSIPIQTYMDGIVSEVRLGRRPGLGNRAFAFSVFLLQAEGRARMTDWWLS